MSLRPYKFQVVPITQVVNDEGIVTDEKPVTAQNGQPLEVFGIAGLIAFAEGFEAQLAAAEATPNREARRAKRKVPVAPRLVA